MERGVKKDDRSRRLAGDVRKIAEPLCFSENIELVHLVCVAGRPETLIRVYLDKPGGITIDDCAHISRQLGDLIDIEIDHLGPYRLEVSSPGVNRPLTKHADFVRFCGERVKIEIDEPIENQKKFTGILESVTDDSIVVACDGKQVRIQSKQICKAKLAGQ